MRLALHEALGSWVPVCTGPLAQEARDVVFAIARELSAARVSDPSVTGQGGIALFHCYLSRSVPDAGFDERARQWLEAAVARVASTEAKHWLYGGFTGLAWTLEHVRSCAPGLLDDADVNQDVDDALLSILRSSPWETEYDLISGLVGLGVYARERIVSAAARECVALVVDRLAELAQTSGDGVTWWTAPRLLHGEASKYPGGCHNLGMAHGVPGVLAFLAGECAQAPVSAMAGRLVEGSARWLLRQRRVIGTASSFGRTAEDGLPARTAWCYGEPGIAIALLAAARATNNRATELAAIDIGLAAASRRAVDTGVVDGGLCHGAAGLAHIYNRLFQATGLRQFAVAACSWIEKTIECWRTRADTDVGFLNGASGVGLSLLAAITDVEPQWDRVMLCSSSSSR
jgi:lantibiotic modifying enzyme